ncbi:MAG: nucleotidyltransferase family protein [Alphaproteobacteria bacterium]|nr:nucleotidyltransferase family protein [Alphaproteobacteria bacterium]
MRPSIALASDANRKALAKLSERHRLTNIRVFGSVARGEDGESSDLDLLVDPLPDLTTLFDIVALKSEAESLLGVPVDVRTLEDLHVSIRARVLGEAKPL